MASRYTLAHVTHEAVEQIGGIGTVLQGLITSDAYKQHVKRSILVGPTSTQISVDPEARLGDNGKVLYSSIDQIDRVGLAGQFKPVEWAFNVAIVYGKRMYDHFVDGTTGEAEVLLIDVFRPNHDRLNQFKFRMWERFRIDSGKYDSAWDYEEYVRLAEPATYALRALMNAEDHPCILFGHEFMGMPACLSAIMDHPHAFRTVFHGHECATARRLVEDHNGHDTIFYNVLDKAMAQGKYVTDVFGDLDGNLRHALVSRSHLCDGVIAVGDRTRDELKFLDPHFDHRQVDIVYNGVPAGKVDIKSKKKSRTMLAKYARELLGYEPDVLMTHVTRPVISKGLWRDLRACHELDVRLAAENRTGMLFILTSGAGTRRPHDVVEMEEEYGWPRSHRPGYPDLVGPEVDICRDVDAFNAGHKAVQVVLVNQFGWSRERIGKRLSKEMNFSDLRRATDVEFGMATYEPFGISPLEPLNAGAICVISNVCGCAGFVQHVTNGDGTPNVIIADYTKLDHDSSIEDLLAMGQQVRDEIETRVSTEIADSLMQRLPKTDKQREKLIAAGQKLVARMGWDQVVEESLAPMLDRISKSPLNGN